ncbi:MAG: HDIG domain-containing metalloprotein [Acidobacteriota bacterium]
MQIKFFGLQSLSRTFSKRTGTEAGLTVIQKLGMVFLLLVLTVFFTFLFSRYSPVSVPRYQPGDIAQADFVVPADISIEDVKATLERKQEARDRVLTVYRFDEALSDRVSNQLSQAFAGCRQLIAIEETEKSPQKRRSRIKPANVANRSEIEAALSQVNPALAEAALVDYLISEGFSTELEALLVGLLKDEFSRMVVDSTDTPRSDHKQIEVLRAPDKPSNLVTVDSIKTLEQAKREVRSSVRGIPGLPERTKAAVVRVLEVLSQPTLQSDPETTQVRLALAEDAVNPVMMLLKRGKVIVRKGDEVQPAQIELMAAIERGRSSGFSVRQASGKFFLIGSLLLIFGYRLRSLMAPEWRFGKLLLLSSAVLVLNLLLVKGFWFVYVSLSQTFLASPFNDKSYFLFALPAAFGSMLIRLVAGEGVALVYSIFCSVLTGLALETDFYGFFYILMSCLIGSLSVRRAMQRVGIIGSGFKLGGACMGLFSVLQIAREAPFDLQTGFFGLALSFFSGPLNGSLIVFSLPLCERLFMVTTDLRLLELGNVNLPLIRELILRAPGTYNHSVAVGTLAEGAAKAIGGNPVFVRVACLYHDIGKSINPEYFVENQQGLNVHDRVTPRESARVVVGHVVEGIRMARAARIPPNIVDIIPQHHGTKLLTFFYEKARKAAENGGEKVREDDYRYPGPKPQSKEAAIIMLADAVEAAARTLKDHSQERLLDLIQKIISHTIDDGQLTECDLTLSEIDRIGYSFLETLSSVYHSRITYPGFDFNQSKTADTAAGTR